MVPTMHPTATLDYSQSDNYQVLELPYVGRDLSMVILMLHAVAHDAFVSVDEVGTEAVAATAVVMRKGESPSEPVEVLLGRPFVFLVRNIETGTIVFLGRVLDPRA